MKKEIYCKRIGSLRQTLTDSSCDTAWIIQPQNRRYLSGYKAEDMHLTESSGSLLINKTERVLVTDSRYLLEAQKEAVGFDVHILNQGSVEGFPELVKRMGTTKLSFEEDYLIYGLHRRLREKFEMLSPPVEFISLNGVIEEMREVKDALEIKAMEASADMISAILEEIIAGLKPGLTEKKVAWMIEDMARNAGAEGLAFPPIVASGPNSAIPHAVPTDRKLRGKEPIILDVGVKLNGYCSDMTRTVFLEEPDSDLKSIYITVRQAQIAALKEVRPGVDSNYPDKIARQVISDAGFAEYFGHALGHGVGLEVHERPRLGPLKPVKLKKGMVVTVEPGIYVSGKGGVRLEETVVIEEDGPRILTKNNQFYDFVS